LGEERTLVKAVHDPFEQSVFGVLSFTEPEVHAVFCRQKEASDPSPSEVSCDP